MCMGRGQIYICIYRRTSQLLDQLGPEVGENPKDLKNVVLLKDIMSYTPKPVAFIELFLTMLRCPECLRVI